MSIDNKSVSSWVRQARYRARKHGIYSDLEVADVQAILNSSKSCAYCSAPADTLDCPFPLKDGGPNVPANTVLCCKKCKGTKGSNDVVWLFSKSHITQEVYLALLKELCARRGGDKIKAHIRRATGLDEGD
jgi:hypothetical protein